jgi:hypothetical protein
VTGTDVLEARMNKRWNDKYQRKEVFKELIQNIGGMMNGSGVIQENEFLVPHCSLNRALGS